MGPECVQVFPGSEQELAVDPLLPCSRGPGQPGGSGGGDLSLSPSWGPLTCASPAPALGNANPGKLGGITEKSELMRNKYINRKRKEEGQVWEGRTP